MRISLRELQAIVDEVQATTSISDDHTTIVWLDRTSDGVGVRFEVSRDPQLVLGGKVVS